MESILHLLNLTLNAVQKVNWRGPDGKQEAGMFLTGQEIFRERSRKQDWRERKR